MTELAVRKCIAPNCEWSAASDRALCDFHWEKLQKAEQQILKSATTAVTREMRQFERLMLIEPPLHVSEIAHRMVWPDKEVQRMLRKFKDDRA